MPELVRLLERQQMLLRIQEEQIAQLKVEYSRTMRDMISRFLVVLDCPEDQDEVRDVLHKALIDMSDEVARLEEHVS
jgi:hypothetical protein